MRRSLAILLSAFLIADVPALAWWETGHEVVARIAAAHLTARARTRIAHILGISDTAHDVTEGMAAASLWADQTKKDTGTGNWHFIDLALQDSESDIYERCPQNACAPVQIDLALRQLRGQVSSSGLSDLDALRYVIHLVGDIHQPLHTISDADLGGNCETLDPAIGTARNLHALWDGGIIAAMNTSQRKLAASLEAAIGTMSGDERADVAAGTPADWAWESHRLAITDVYQKLRIPTEPVLFPQDCREAPAEITGFKLSVNAAYVDSMESRVRQQLTKAGLRLAAALNTSFN